MSAAYLAGGCFWCITPPIAAIPGVERVTAGFSGGEEREATYEDVKHQRTGHRETVMVEYDPERVTFGQILDVFLENIDPFDGGGQYIDRGRSYTAAVYTVDEDQLETARQKLSALEDQAGKRCAVTLEPFRFFIPAGDEHQDYYLRHPEEFACEIKRSGRK